MNSEKFEINEKVKICEVTKEGNFYWQGDITKIENAFIEVCFRRDINTIPQHVKFPYTFEKIFQKFYGKDKKFISKI